MSDGARHHPRAREDRLLIEPVGAETVVYDVDRMEAHCLSPLAALVFAHSDGQSSIVRLAELTSTRLGKPVDVEQVEAALGQLEERDLMAAPTARGMSRRDFAKRTAVTAALSVPLVTTIVTPAAAQSATSCRTGVACSMANEATVCGTVMIAMDSCKCSMNTAGVCVFN